MPWNKVQDWIPKIRKDNTMTVSFCVMVKPNWHRNVNSRGFLRVHNMYIRTRWSYIWLFDLKSMGQFLSLPPSFYFATWISSKNCNIWFGKISKSSETLNSKHSFQTNVYYEYSRLSLPKSFLNRDSTVSYPWLRIFWLVCSHVIW